MKKIFCFLFLFLLLKTPFVLADDLKLEGIVYEAKDPQTSVVIINGAFLKPGDTFQGYKILEVKPDSVKVSSSTGQTRELYVIGGKLDPAKGNVAVEKVPLEEPAKKKPENPIMTVLTSPFSMISRATEVRTIAELRQLGIAAAVYYSEYGETTELNKEVVTIDTLIEKGLVSRAFQGGVKGGYKFDLRPDQTGIGVGADPVDSNSKARHFYIDGHGALFVDEGKPATDRSKAFEI